MITKTISTETKKLNKDQIQKIISLKNTQWKFGITSQKTWFRKNVKPQDMHSLLYYKSILIGYTLLRKRSFFEKKYSKKKLTIFYLIQLLLKKNIETKILLIYL